MDSNLDRLGSTPPKRWRSLLKGVVVFLIFMCFIPLRANFIDCVCSIFDGPAVTVLIVR